MMEQLQSYEALAPELNALLFSRACVNSVPEREALEAEIAAGALWTEHLGDGLLLLQRTPDLQRLRFLLPDPAALCQWKPDRRTALELPFRRGDTRFPDLAAALEAAGWRLLLNRVRLTRKAAPAPVSIGFESSKSPDPEALLGLLYACFSSLTGCLPDRAELNADLAEGRLLAAEGGLIRWRQKGKTSEIRHLAVSPDCRGKGLAKALVTAYLNREEGKLCRVWTGADNAPALRVYHGFGYAEDGWESLVLLYDCS